MVTRPEAPLEFDCFIFGGMPFDRPAVASARVVGVGPSTTLSFAGPEHTLAGKIVWYYEGGRQSEDQWRDIVGVLRVQAGDSDRDLARRWIGTVGLTDLLEEFFAEADDLDAL